MELESSEHLQSVCDPLCTPLETFSIPGRRLQEQCGFPKGLLSPPGLSTCVGSGF